LATKVLAGHIGARLDGRFTTDAGGKVRETEDCNYFRSLPTL